MVVDVVVLILGLVVLAWAADVFVLGAARLAAAWRVSPVVIGAVLVGFGTGLPELFVSATAAADGARDIAVGNIIGSNLANLTLVLGVAGLLVEPRVTSGVLRREAPLSFLAVLAFAAAMQGGSAAGEGLFLLAALAVAVGLIVRMAPEHSALEDEVGHFVEPAQAGSRASNLLRTLAGLAGTLIGAQLVVAAARSVADRAALSDGFVGVTLVAVGTSLPELVTAIQSARRNETALLLGNVLGSNIFNSLGVAGVATLVSPGPVADHDLTTVGVGLMVVVAGLTWVFLGLAGRLRRWESAVLLAVYLATLPLLA